MDTEYELSRFRDIETIKLDDGGDAAVAIDQTQLPNRLAVVSLKTPEDFHGAICRLAVRGAPAIGVAAAFGLYLAAKGIAARLGGRADALSQFFSELRAAKEYLCSARPTAVNLGWALERMERAARAEIEEAEAEAAGLETDGAGLETEAEGLEAEAAGLETDGARAPDTLASRALDTAANDGNDAGSMQRIVARMRRECDAIHGEDAEACRRIGEHGLALLKPGMGLLTHCNAGRLATTRYGTATAPIYIGQERGYGFRVYCDETRPLLQGARLTAFELMASGVDTTLICDNMAPSVMSEGLVDAVLVGCDRAAANGDAANKIGTSYVALAAKHFGIPIYFFAPTSTIDLACATGADISIERRAAEEVTEMWYARRMAPRGVKVYNPGFDVTPARHITAIVTERGVAWPPYDDSLAALMLGR